MIVDNVRNYTNGWIIGDFFPTLVKTDAVEIAHHRYPKGFAGAPHTHKVATEYNYIINGSLVASGRKLYSGDIFIYEPDEVSCVDFLEDTNLLVIKLPSVPGDKYEVKS